MKNNEIKQDYEILEKEQQYRSKETELKNDATRITLDKIHVLKQVLEATKIKNSPMMGSETVYQNVLTDDEANQVRAKMMDIIKEL